MGENAGPWVQDSWFGIEKIPTLGSPGLEKGYGLMLYKVLGGQGLGVFKSFSYPET